MSPGRAWLAERRTPSAHHADSGRIDVQAVAAALLHHLGIASDDCHARALRPPRAMDSTTRRNVAIGRPSSRMNADAQKQRLARRPRPDR